MDLDERDAQILLALCRDGRATIPTIARAVDVPAPTVQERLQALEESGVVQGYTPRLGYEALGFDLTVIFRLSVDGDALAALTERLGEEPRLIAVYEVTGRFNVVAIGKYADSYELSECLSQFQTDPAIQVVDPVFVRTIASEHEPLDLVGETDDTGQNG